jgi:hypothetical protein
MKDFLVLTANLGGKDRLLDPPVVFDNCDYIAIVDALYDVNVWQQFGNYTFSNIDIYQHRRNAKIYKVLSSILFSSYKYIIWNDANHQLRVNPESILEEYGDFDLLLFKHPHRNCCYKEMEIVSERNLDIRQNISNQYEHYLSKGMPEEFGLYEMTCYIKKVSPKITELELAWWEQICKFSSRDQCSFTFCLWALQNQLEIKTFNAYANLYAGGNKYFSEQNHLS